MGITVVTILFYSVFSTHDTFKKAPTNHQNLWCTSSCFGPTKVHQSEGLPTVPNQLHTTSNRQLTTPVLWGDACASSHWGNGRPACRWFAPYSAHVRPSSCPESPQKWAPRLHRRCDISPPSVGEDNKGERGKRMRSHLWWPGAVIKAFTWEGYWGI